MTYNPAIGDAPYKKTAIGGFFIWCIAYNNAKSENPVVSRVCGFGVSFFHSFSKPNQSKIGLERRNFFTNAKTSTSKNNGKADIPYAKRNHSVWR